MELPRIAGDAGLRSSGYGLPEARPLVELEELCVICRNALLLEVSML
jgi:hypothetical protein